MRIFILALLCAIFVDVEAQVSRYSSGYIVTVQGDTLRGEIGFGNWVYNPDAVEFRSGDKSQTITPASVAAFGVEGIEAYRAVKVSYLLNPIALHQASISFSDQNKAETVFLRVVTTGKYSLYAYNTPNRPYYFFQENNGLVQELIYGVAMIDEELKKLEVYKNDILLMATAEKKAALMESRINTLAYEESSLRSVFEQLNGSSQKHHVKKSGQFNWFAAAGAYYTGFNLVSHKDGSFRGMEFDKAITPAIGINLSFVPGRGNSRWAVNAGIEYMMMNIHGYALINQGGVKSRTYDNNMHVILLPVGLEHQFNPRGKLAFFANGSLGFTVIIASKATTIHKYDNNYPDEITYDDPKSNAGYIQYALSAGAKFNRHKLGLYYSGTTSVIDESFVSLTGRMLGLKYQYQLRW